MIVFQDEPDPIFLAIVHEALVHGMSTSSAISLATG
jgi:hypothetical protein